MRRKSRME